MEFHNKNNYWDKDLPKREIWHNSFRVLKEGSFGLVFSSVRLIHRFRRLWIYNKRNFIGYELEKEYYERSMKRLKETENKLLSMLF